MAELLQVRTNARLRQAQRIVDLEATYGPARQAAACTRACAYGDPRYLTIKNILAAGLDRQAREVPLSPLERPTQVGAFLRGAEAFGARGEPALVDTPITPPSAGGGAGTDPSRAPEPGERAEPLCDVGGAGDRGRRGGPCQFEGEFAERRVGRGSGI